MTEVSGSILCGGYYGSGGLKRLVRAVGVCVSLHLYAGWSGRVFMPCDTVGTHNNGGFVLVFE